MPILIIHNYQHKTWKALSLVHAKVALLDIIMCYIPNTANT